jgi:hypothetical protein
MVITNMNYVYLFTLQRNLCPIVKFVLEVCIPVIQGYVG